MRNTLMLIGCLLLLTACANDDDYFGGNRHDRYDDRYDGRYGYGGGYGNYYPYGNPYYSRDRIYIIDRYHPCSGYAYQGYCYRYKDDYQKAIAWDRSHGYDDNWHKKRKDWCKKHDCSHDRDRYDRDGRSAGSMQPVPAQPGHPSKNGAHDNRHQGRANGDGWQQPREGRPVERHERPSTHQQPVDVQKHDDRVRDYDNRQRRPGNHQSRQEQPRQEQPRQEQPRQSQPRIPSSGGGQASQEGQAQESRSRDSGSSRDSSSRDSNTQERQSQRGRAARAGVTPE